MSRNLEREMDLLKLEIAELKEMVRDMTGSAKPVNDYESERDAEHPQAEDAPHKRAGHIYKMNRMHPMPEINAILSNLEDEAGTKNQTGAITYLGVFSSGDRQSTWIKNGINTDDLLALIEKGSVDKVLACIGNQDRMNILLSLLRNPKTIAELVEKCGFTSTGSVYHHIKPLLAADMIFEAERGVYAVVSYRVQGIIMLLAGISDMLDPQYSSGVWDNSYNV